MSFNWILSCMSCWWIGTCFSLFYYKSCQACLFIWSVFSTVPMNGSLTHGGQLHGGRRLGRAQGNHDDRQAAGSPSHYFLERIPAWPELELTATTCMGGRLIALGWRAKLQSRWCIMCMSDIKGRGLHLYQPELYITVHITLKDSRICAHNEIHMGKLWKSTIYITPLHISSCLVRRIPITLSTVSLFGHVSKHKIRMNFTNHKRDKHLSWNFIAPTIVRVMGYRRWCGNSPWKAKWVQPLHIPCSKQETAQSQQSLIRLKGKGNYNVKGSGCHFQKHNA